MNDNKEHIQLALSLVRSMGMCNHEPNSYCIDECVFMVREDTNYCTPDSAFVKAKAYILLHKEDVVEELI